MDAELSPRRLARIGGALYLIIIAIGLSGEVVVRNRVFVAGDAAATAENLRSLEGLWRLGIAAEYLLLVCAIPLAVILYLLLRPVSRELALAALAFNLVSLAVEAVVSLNLLVALTPANRGRIVGALEPAQLDALASLSIQAHALGFGVALIFFGCFAIVAGYLIYASGFLPKPLGVLMQLAGFSYLVNSFAFILAPGLATALFPAVLVPAFVGELALAAWLLARGVDEQQWKGRVIGVAPADTMAVRL